MSLKKKPKKEHSYMPDQKIAFGMGNVERAIEFVDYVDNVYILDQPVSYNGRTGKKISFADGDRIFNPR